MLPARVPAVCGCVCVRADASAPLPCAVCRRAQAIAEHGVKLVSWAQLLELGAAQPAEPVPPSADDICTIMYTSGTTGETGGQLARPRVCQQCRMRSTLHARAGRPPLLARCRQATPRA